MYNTFTHTVQRQYLYTGSAVVPINTFMLCTVPCILVRAIILHAYTRCPHVCFNVSMFNVRTRARRSDPKL